MGKLITCILVTLYLIILAVVPCPVLGAEIDLGATEHDGTIESQTYHLGVNIKSENSYAIAQWNYGKVSNIVTTDNGSLRLGYDTELLHPTKLHSFNHWSFWFFNQTGYNNTRGIVIENLLGAGPKYTFIKNEMVSAIWNYSISLSTGIIYHYENGAYGKRNLGRLSIRPKARIADDNTSVSFVAFYQPNLEDFGDYIITGELVSQHKVTERMSLKLVLTDEYRSITSGSKNEFTRMLIMGIKI